jgi:hypothetical protein
VPVLRKSDLKSPTLAFMNTVRSALSKGGAHRGIVRVPQKGNGQNAKCDFLLKSSTRTVFTLACTLI